MHGLFDTGNDHTTISGALLREIGGKLSGPPITVRGVTGSAQAGRTKVTLAFEFDENSKVTIEAHEVAVLEGADEHVLIGRDFLERFDITISRDGTVLLDC